MAAFASGAWRWRSHDDWLLETVEQVELEEVDEVVLDVELELCFFFLGCFFFLVVELELELDELVLEEDDELDFLAWRAGFRAGAAGFLAAAAGFLAGAAGFCAAAAAGAFFSS